MYIYFIIKPILFIVQFSYGFGVVRFWLLRPLLYAVFSRVLIPAIVILSVAVLVFTFNISISSFNSY